MDAAGVPRAAREPEPARARRGARRRDRRCGDCAGRSDIVGSRLRRAARPSRMRAGAESARPCSCGWRSMWQSLGLEDVWGSVERSRGSLRVRRAVRLRGGRPRGRAGARRSATTLSTIAARPTASKVVNDCRAAGALARGLPAGGCGGLRRTSRSTVTSCIRAGRLAAPTRRRLPEGLVRRARGRRDHRLLGADAARQSRDAPRTA